MLYEIICPSIRPNLFNGLRISLLPEKVRFFDGRRFESFAALVNGAIESSEAKFIIISNDKARPDSKSVRRILKLLKSGYGLVGLYRFGFFGISKDLFDSLDGFDEGYSDGGFEDNDFLIRLKYADVGVYLAEEIAYLSNVPSSWKHENSRRYFFERYKFFLVSKLISVKFRSNYHNNGDYLPWSESQICNFPLTSYSSNFDKFLRVADIRHEDDLATRGIRFRLFGAAKNLKNLFIINPRHWKNYRF